MKACAVYSTFYIHIIFTNSSSVFQKRKEKIIWNLCFLRSPYIRDYTSSDRFADIAVDWDPISGYPQRLPSSYYPRPAVGVGTAMGLQIILNGHVNDYFCSSTNGQGFKVCNIEHILVS